jgi:hypothetical protein
MRRASPDTNGKDAPPLTQEQANEAVRAYCDARPPAYTGTAPAP